MAKTQKTDQIAKLLAKGRTAGENDVRAFKQWVDYNMTTPELIRTFKYNNHVPKDIDIDPEALIDWLDEIGWRRTLWTSGKDTF